MAPATLKAAMKVVEDHPDYLIVAGCTDAMVDGSIHSAKTKGVIDLFGLAEISQIEQSENSLIIGSAVPYKTIINNEKVVSVVPMLAQACELIGALQIQARATVGGNLVTSSPVGDTLPVWLASDALVECVSTKKTRMVPYEDFIGGYRKVDLQKNEIIKAIHVPLSIKNKIQRFTKVGTRAYQSISKVMMAGSVLLKDDRLTSVRLALGAVAVTPMRCRNTEKKLEGQKWSKELLEDVEAEVLKEIHPIDDIRSTAKYRAQVAANSCKSFLESLEIL